MAEKRVKNKKRRANIGLAVLSIILAMALWLILSVTTLSEIQVTLRDVPIDFSLENSYAELNGLSVISRDLENISVSFTGQRDRIGNYTADDIRVSLDLNTVRTSGSYDLPLIVESVNGDQIENIEIAPRRTVHVEFDRFNYKTLTVDNGSLRLDLSNIRAAEGYVIDEEEIAITPSEVILYGPQDYLDQVTSCVISFVNEMRLSESINASTTNIKLYSNNAVFDNPRVSLESDLFNVLIPVYRTKSVPLKVAIQSYSDEIDVSGIEYTLSTDSILVRSQTIDPDTLEDITIGTISLRDIRPGFVETLTIGRDSHYDNISGIDEVEVRFDLDGYIEKTLTLTNSQILQINRSSEYNVIIETDRMQVTLVGPAEELEALDASSVVAQINLLDYTLYTGPRFFNTTVYVPGHPDIWSVGIAQVYAQVEPVQQEDDEQGE